MTIKVQTVSGSRFIRIKKISSKNGDIVVKGS